MELGIGAALGFGRSRLARVIAEAVFEQGTPVHVASLAEELARPLATQGLPVVAVTMAAKRRKKGPPSVAARRESLPFAEGALDAVVLSGLADGAALREAARVVKEGGLVALSTRAAQARRATPEGIAAAMVHAALVDVTQRRVSGSLLTMARVQRWA